MRWISSCMACLPWLARFADRARIRPAWRGGRARAAARGGRALAPGGAGHLVRDDLVLDLIVDILRHDLALDELVLALIRAVGDDRLGARCTDAGQLVELGRRGRVDVDEAALLLRSGGGARLPRGAGHRRRTIGRR